MATHILHAIQALQQLGGIDNRSEEQFHEARQLLDKWLELPDADTELARLGEWLQDEVEPLETSTSPQAAPPVVEKEEWNRKVRTILGDGWEQFERFEKGDLAERAKLLWMEYYLIDPASKQDRNWEISTLHFELERHIDPQGIIHAHRMERFNKKMAEELRQKGDHHAADLRLLPKDQWECPKECGKEEWANIIKRHDRRENKEEFKEFLARLELAKAGLLPGQDKTPQQALEMHLEDPHTKIREKLEAGASTVEILELINRQPKQYNHHGLIKFADEYRLDLERRDDLKAAVDNLLLRGEPPAIRLEDYFPAEWLPRFRVLRDGMRFPDEAIVTIVMAVIAGVLPPKTRISGWSMVETPTVWVFIIGSSGTAKSVLFKELFIKPMEQPLRIVDGWNAEDLQRRKAATEAGEEMPPYRKRNLIYTSPSTQGIRADMAVHGEEVPGILGRDELNGWLKQMADEGGAGTGDTEFYLSSYDGCYSNDVFADSKKSREVRCGKLTVIGGIQPQVFIEQLEAGNANGFNSRPLFVHLPRLKRELLQPDEETAKLTELLGELYQKALESEIHRFVLSKEAEAVFKVLFDQLEELSIQANSDPVEAAWAKAPGQVLRVAAAIHFWRVASGQEEALERGMVDKAQVVSARTLELAANIVLAGKNRAVEIQERAANPTLELATRLMEKLEKLEGKAGGKGIPLSELRKGWSSKDRPSLKVLKQVATLCANRGLVKLLDGGKSIRMVR